ncbi:unnamed protein product [Meloidogyne enterolobii]|uniref:Uncharacterized protein n=1 Tax=Meloidogyne enterolobii TaxID=390850 RepID=A0ACB1AVK7_MELEN
MLDIFDPMQSVEKEEWIKQKVKFGELSVEMIVDTASQINVVPVKCGIVLDNQKWKK